MYDQVYVDTLKAEIEGGKIAIEELQKENAQLKAENAAMRDMLANVVKSVAPFKPKPEKRVSYA